MGSVEFEATVRGQKGLMLIGKVTSKKLIPFINKKVKIKVKEVEE